MSYIFAKEMVYKNYFLVTPFKDLKIYELFLIKTNFNRRNKKKINKKANNIRCSLQNEDDLTIPVHRIIHFTTNSFTNHTYLWLTLFKWWPSIVASVRTYVLKMIWKRDTPKGVINAVNFRSTINSYLHFGK